MRYAGSDCTPGDFLRGNATGGTSTDLPVLTNGVSIFDSSVIDFGSQVPFTRGFNLATGDTVDVAVGDNGNGLRAIRSVFSDHRIDTEGLSPSIALMPRSRTSGLTQVQTNSMEHHRHCGGGARRSRGGNRFPEIW